MSAHHKSVQLRHAAIGLMAAGLLAGMAAFGPAEATPFSFNFTFGGGTDQTYSPAGPGTLLSSATSVTEGLNQFILSVQSVFGPPAGALNDVLNYVSTPLAVPAAASGALVNGLTLNWDGIYSFTSITGTYLRDPINDALNFKWIGFFTDSSNVLDTQGAQYTQTWSQSAPDIRPSTSGTFNSNPAITVVPEPAAPWLLGTTLLGLGLVRKRLFKGARWTAALT